MKREIDDQIIRSIIFDRTLMKLNMKRLILSLAAVVAMFAGCQKPELESPFGNDLSFVASVEAFSSQTKTAMNSDRQLFWTAGDRIAIFMGSTLADEYAIDESCAGKSQAIFNLVEDNGQVNGSFSAGSELPCNIAFYPSASGLSLMGASMEEESSYEIEGYSLPSVQHYAAKSFGNGALPMVAMTKNMEDRNLKFKNVLGAMKLQLKGTQVVKSIKVEGANGEKLSGAATITAYADNLTPAITMIGTDEASKSVTLDCGNGVQLKTAKATDFIIALPPVLFANGFTVTVTDTNSDSYTISAKVANTVLRSSILVMPEVLLESDDEDSGDDVGVLNDYIDEYGVNHGKGVKIGKTVWAPVNCGYHATDYQWGKLYQWGRKYGQGYSGGFYGPNGNKTGNTSDATIPQYSEGGVSLEYGQSADNKNVFFTCPDFPYDWLSLQDGTLWNSGTEESPKKTEYDPCPRGWRVPTYAELSELSQNCSSSTTNDAGCYGLWFSGTSTYTESAPRVFLPAGGYRDYYAGDAGHRGYYGYYWSSRPRNSNYADNLYFNGGSARMSNSGRALGSSVRCVQNTSGEPAQDDLDEDLLIPVLGVTLNSTSLKLYEDDYVQLKAKVLPVDATNKSVVWSSSDPAVATVDQSGFVTAVSVGTAEIYAQAGDFVATCNVTVEEPTAATLDYVDEYGINHGKGVQIGETVWAPVNCGYHATDYLWGKLYQWGRKYGQGYAGYLYDMVHYSDYSSFVPIGAYVADVTTPELFEGPVSLQDGQSLNNKNVFFTCPDSQYDWLSSQDGTFLWNSGTEESPVKSEFDPCPEGWRVPTYAELEQLQQNHSSWTTDVNGHEGYYFCGINSYSETVPQIFLPAGGYRDYYAGDAGARDAVGVYWSSWLSYDWGVNLYFHDTEISIVGMAPANGCSVRCVQE